MTDAYRMAYEDTADRVPVLLIHGYPLNNTLWDLQVGDLCDVARIITPDLRGFGRSDPAPVPGGVGTYADDCASLLDDLGLTGPVVVGGLSMGGYVVFEFCRRYPERVAGLILAATRRRIPRVPKASRLSPRACCRSCSPPTPTRPFPSWPHSSSG